MIKHEVLRTGVNLKEFFEASVDALQNDGKPSRNCKQTIRRNCALVQRTRTDPTLTKRAVADAARTLTALWRTQS
jgi:hypothetical protein